MYKQGLLEMTENTLLLPYTVIRVASVIETLGTKLLKSFINYLPPITEVRVF